MVVCCLSFGFSCRFLLLVVGLGVICLFVVCDFRFRVCCRLISFVSAAEWYDCWVFCGWCVCCFGFIVAL